MGTKHKLKWSPSEVSSLKRSIKKLGQQEAISAHAKKYGRTTAAIAAKFYSLQDTVKQPKKQKQPAKTTEELIIATFSCSEYKANFENGSIHIIKR
jgi:hypothetical protein